MKKYDYQKNSNIIFADLGGGMLYQFSNRAGAQMMTYLIETPDGKLCMIDSGHTERVDVELMLDAVKQHGGVVEYWFITHAHDDHFGGLLALFEDDRLKEITVKNLCFAFPSVEWQNPRLSRDIERKEIAEFMQYIDNCTIPVTELKRGMVFTVGGMEFEILNDCESREEYDNVNDTSIVIRANFPRRSVLFLADIAVKSEKYLLESCDRDKLRCDIVQMAHHGQDGVDRAFYEIVEPKICLYTAPLWLWDCDKGGGFGTGPWKTIETRRWMQELGVQISCPHAYGDYLFV